MPVNDQGEVKYKLHQMNMSGNEMDTLKVQFLPSWGWPKAELLQGSTFCSLTFEAHSRTGTSTCVMVLVESYWQNKPSFKPQLCSALCWWLSELVPKEDCNSTDSHQLMLCRTSHRGCSSLVQSSSSPAQEQTPDLKAVFPPSGRCSSSSDKSEVLRNERSRSNLCFPCWPPQELSCSLRKRVCDEHYQQQNEFKGKVLCYLKRHPAPLHFLHSTWRTWPYANHTCWFTNSYQK